MIDLPQNFNFPKSIVGDAAEDFLLDGSQAQPDFNVFSDVETEEEYVPRRSALRKAKVRNKNLHSKII